MGGFRVLKRKVLKNLQVTMALYRASFKTVERKRAIDLLGFVFSAILWRHEFLLYENLFLV